MKPLLRPSWIYSATGLAIAIGIALWLALDESVPGEGHLFIQWMMALSWGTADSLPSLLGSVYSTPLWLAWLRFVGLFRDLPIFDKSSLAVIVLIKLAPMSACFAWARLSWSALMRSKDQSAGVGLLWTQAIAVTSWLGFPLLFDATTLGHYSAIIVLAGCCLVYLLQKGKHLAGGCTLGALLALSPVGLALIPYVLLATAKESAASRRGTGLFLAGAGAALVFGALHFVFGVTKQSPFDVLASAGAFNMFTLFGQNLERISATTLGVGGTWTLAIAGLLGLAGVGRWLLNNRKRDRFNSLKEEEEEEEEEDSQLLLIGAATAVLATLLLPGMPPGAATVCLAFLPFLNIRLNSGQASPALRLYLLFLAVIAVELHLIHRHGYGAKEYLSLFGTDLRLWRTPSMVFITLAKIGFALSLLWPPSGRPIVASAKPKGLQAMRSFGELADHVLRHIWQQQRNFSMQAVHWFFIILCTAGALILSLRGLGSHQLPQTFTSLNGEWSVVPDHGGVAQTIWIVKSHHRVLFRAGCRGEATQITEDLGLGESYGYKSFQLNPSCPRGVDIAMKSKGSHAEGHFYEVLLANSKGQLLQTGDVCSAGTCRPMVGHPLFDETTHLSAPPTRFDGTIFDENFNIETALKWLRFPDEPVLTTAHPFLGRATIAVSLKAFGINPWAWRFPGAVAGALIPAALFFFCGFLTGDRRVATIAACLAFFDHARLGLSQLATVDSQLTLWIILTHLSLIIYCRQRLNNIYGRPECSENAYSNWGRVKLWLALAALAVSFGAAISIKWIGAFAAPVIVSAFFVLQKAEVFRVSSTIKKSHALHLYAGTLVSLSLIAATSASIYFAAYLPFLRQQTEISSAATSGTSSDTSGAVMPGRAPESTMGALIAHQKRILDIHTRANVIHRNSSQFSAWPFMNRPLQIDRRAAIDPDAVEQSYIFGNPLIWWAILPSFGAIFYFGMYRRRPEAGYLAIAFASQYLPWVFVERPTFIYHFLTAWVFGVAAVAFVFAHLSRRYKISGPIYAILVISAFFWFYPLTNSTPISLNRLEQSQWFDGWFE